MIRIKYGFLWLWVPSIHWIFTSVSFLYDSVLRLGPSQRGLSRNGEEGLRSKTVVTGWRSGVTLTLLFSAPPPTPPPRFQKDWRVCPSGSSSPLGVLHGNLDLLIYLTGRTSSTSPLSRMSWPCLRLQSVTTLVSNRSCVGSFSRGYDLGRGGRTDNPVG